MAPKNLKSTSRIDTRCNISNPSLLNSTLMLVCWFHDSIKSGTICSASTLIIPTRRQIELANAAKITGHDRDEENFVEALRCLNANGLGIRSTISTACTCLSTATIADNLEEGSMGIPNASNNTYSIPPCQLRFRLRDCLCTMLQHPPQRIRIHYERN